MFNLCIFLLGSQVQYVLNFKTRESAELSRENIRARRKQMADVTTIKDDYSQELDLPTEQIASVYLEDVNQSYFAKIDNTICQKKAEQAFIKKRSEDVELIRLFPSNQATQQFGGGHA